MRLISTWQLAPSMRSSRTLLREAKPLRCSAIRVGTRLQSFSAILSKTMFGEALYRSCEEKAAHLVYFVVKDRPFTNGNKRIGALLFFLYMQQEGIRHQLDPRTLTALTLLIAESAPANKDLMIRLIMNLLCLPVELVPRSVPEIRRSAPLMGGAMTLSGRQSSRPPNTDGRTNSKLHGMKCLRRPRPGNVKGYPRRNRTNSTAIV